MMRETPNDYFRRMILAVAQANPTILDGELKTLAEQFRAAFLRYGSQTDDNTSCMDAISVGRTNDGTSAKRRKIGYTFENLDANVADILHSAEGCQIPEQVERDYPDITQHQWDAALRLATVFFVALEGVAPLGEADAGQQIA
ncbi:MAG TPA: hypothetical protein DDW52_04370 [Planctomycetaceae bacterium]|nr:hypothetical protein [Planctomycetaceae bacterium]